MLEYRDNTDATRETGNGGRRKALEKGGWGEFCRLNRGQIWAQDTCFLTTEAKPHNRRWEPGRPGVQLSWGARGSPVMGGRAGSSFEEKAGLKTGS